MKHKEWEPISWYCPNCGILLGACKTEAKELKLTCSKCNCDMLVSVSKNHWNVKLYRPQYR